MTLRAGIDATAWPNQRGDGRFVRNAVRRLVALYPDVEWVLYADAPSAERIEVPDGASVRPVRQGRPPTEALGTTSSRRPADLARLILAVRRREIDVFLSPSVYSYFPVLGVPSVVGLHDANAMIHPRLVLPSRRDRLLWRIKQALAVRGAAHLFTVSHASRAAISDHLGIPAETIGVVPEAPDPVFTPQPADAIEAACRAHGLSREQGYFVFAAGISPHKGLESLLDAYVLLRSRSRSVPPLLVVGSLQGPYASAGGSVRGGIEGRGLGGIVRLPGFVADRPLACLYSGATAAIVPSLSEGFGLAAVEAAACGAPVVLSDIGPHRETLGGSALFFPPGDSRALRERLARLLDSPEDRRLLGERARAAAARLSWDDTARRLRGLLADTARAG
jgi:glycosyltransferase involved in cell wall biosynthesis